MDEERAIATWSLSDFRGLCYRMLQWNAAFDYVLFKRREPFLRDLIAKLRKLQLFLEKSDYRLVPHAGGSSLAQIADALPEPDEPRNEE